MMKKIFAGIIIIGATVISLPTFAASLSQNLPETAVATVSASGNQGTQPGDTPSTDVDSINLKYTEDLVFDTGKILAAPLHWEAKDWIKAGLVLGVTSSLFLVDQRVKDFAQSHQSPVASKFALVGNSLGNGLYTAPALGAFYLYGYLGDDHKARRTSLLALESFAISGVMTSGLKMLAERQRPNSGKPPNTWGGPHLSLKSFSFSSGHSASAFSMATVIADQYKDNPYVPPIAYGLATLTGMSRLYSNAHWSSDVFFGAALGYFVSKGVEGFHKDDTIKKPNRLTIMPAVSKEMTGLTMRYQF